jgi:hypothetical protein
LLRGPTDRGLRLGYRTLFGHHGFGPSFGLLPVVATNRFQVQICERKQKNVIALAGLVDFRDAAMKLAC